MTLAFLIPEFPGQTHGFFWREMRCVEKRAGEVCIVSTRPPKSSPAHQFSDAAARRTTYLSTAWKTDLFGSLFGALAGLLAAPKVRQDMRAQGAEETFAKVLVLCVVAQFLKRICARQGVQHVHGHSCADVAYILALCHRFGGLSFSLTLHGELGVYGRGHAFKFRTRSSCPA